MWDGNVPTNYKIKTSKDSSSDDDKNLGRWINRQRSLYQAGRLKEERRIELEKIGLKWAVLSTTSWHSMFEALCDYVKARKSIDKNNHWDGHVPGNYETNDKPPKRLGRWVTRQRAQYSSKKLKSEQIEKLEKIGLSWEPIDNSKVVSAPYMHKPVVQKPKALPVTVAVAKHPIPKALPVTVAVAKHPIPKAVPATVTVAKHPIPKAVPVTVTVAKHPIPKAVPMTVGVAKHPIPKAVVPVVRQVKTAIPPTSALKLPTKNTPPVASLKPATPSVASLKSPPLTKPPSSVVNNK